jgi:hypothetical protein
MKQRLFSVWPALIMAALIANLFPISWPLMAQPADPKEPMFRVTNPKRGLRLPHCLSVAQAYQPPGWPCWDAQDKKVIGLSGGLDMNRRYQKGTDQALDDKQKLQTPKFTTCDVPTRKRWTDGEKLWYCWHESKN